MSLAIGGWAHRLSALHAVPGALGLAILMRLFGTSLHADALLVAQSGLMMMNMAQMLLLEQFMVDHERQRVAGNELISFKSGLILAAVSGCLGLILYAIAWGGMWAYGRTTDEMVLAAAGFMPAVAASPLFHIARSTAYCSRKGVGAEALSLGSLFIGVVVPALMLLGWVEESAWGVALAQSLATVIGTFCILALSWPKRFPGYGKPDSFIEAMALAKKTMASSLRMRLVHNIHDVGSLAVINWVLAGMQQGAAASFFYAKRISDAAFAASSNVPVVMMIISGAKASTDDAAKRAYLRDCSTFWRRGLAIHGLAYTGAIAACAILLWWSGLGAFSEPFWILVLLAFSNAANLAKFAWIALLIGMANSRIFAVANSVFIITFAALAKIGVWVDSGAWFLALSALLAQLPNALIFRYAALKQLAPEREEGVRQIRTVG